MVDMGGTGPDKDFARQQQRKRAAAKDSSIDRMGGVNVGDFLGSQASSMAELLNQQAANIMRNNNASPITGLPEDDPLEAMMNDLMGQVNSISVARTPLEELKRMADMQVGAQFDPMIQMLRDQMNQKSTRAGRNQGEAKGMYNALADDFLAQLPQMTNAFAQEDAAANARYDNAQSELQRLYGAQSQQQNDVLQKLGIQAAAPDASRQAQEDQKYFQGKLESDQQSALNALNQQQNAAETYQRNLGDTSRMAGENAAQSIGQQLEDYLDSANSQMGGLQAQRGQALSALLSQMQSQDESRAASAEQTQFNNLMKLAEFQLGVSNAKTAALKAAGDNKGFTTGLPGAQNFLSQQYMTNPAKGANLMQMLQTVLDNQDVKNGKFILTPEDKSSGKAAVYSPMTDERMMEMLRNAINKENEVRPGRYDNADINNSIAALQAYLGKLRQG